MTKLTIWVASIGMVFMISCCSMTVVTVAAPYDTNSNRIPSKRYDAANGVTYNTPSGPFHIDSFFDIFTEIDLAPPPAPGTPPRIDSFFDVFTEISLSPPSGPPLDVVPPSQMQIKTTSPGAVCNPCTFSTEMLQLNLQGGGLPAGVMVRESPTLPSVGQTSITDLGGGLFHIDSFFDVFTELSLDGGQSWSPSNGPMQLNGSGTPEPGAATLLGLGLVLIGLRGRQKQRVR